MSKAMLSVIVYQLKAKPSLTSNVTVLPNVFANLTPPLLKGLFIQNVNSGITISPSYQLKCVQFPPLSEKGYVAECSFPIIHIYNYTCAN